VLVHRNLQLSENAHYFFGGRDSDTSTQFTDFVFDTARWRGHTGGDSEVGPNTVAQIFAALNTLPAVENALTQWI
jgi:hypothetical protein